MTEKLKNKTILVCGGCGFIGTNFIKFLLRKYGEEIKIVNYDKLTYAGNLTNFIKEQELPNYFFLWGDVTDKESLHSVVKEFMPDFIINFAAETHVDRSIHGYAGEFVNTNIYGVYNLLELVREYKMKFLQVSTDEVYGSIEKGRFIEDSPLKPNSPYSASKASGDLLCRAYFKTFSVPVILTRCSNNFGPYQYPEKQIPYWIYKLSNKKKVPVYGDGLNVRDWVFVDDHCEALELCLVEGKSGEVYNIGGNNERTNLEIAQILLNMFGNGEVEFVQDRPGHDKRYAVDFSKINKELGWKPESNFNKKLVETIQWYADNKSWVEDIKAKTGEFNPHIK